MLGQLVARSTAAATFRDSQIGAILPSHLQAWVKGLSARLAPATVKVYYNLVSSAFRAAVTDKVIAENPCAGAKLPRERRREAAMTISAPEQVKAALDAAPEWFAPYVAVCAFAGLRLGEAAGLRLTDVDFLRRTISVSRQIQGNTKASAEVVPPKHGSERVVYVAEELVQILAQHVERSEYSARNSGSSVPAERTSIGTPHLTDGGKFGRLPA